MTYKIFHPTEWQRGFVEAVTACGLRPDEIAHLIGINTPLLIIHFQDEIYLGQVRARAELINKLFKNISDLKDAILATFALVVSFGTCKSGDHPAGPFS